MTASPPRYQPSAKTTPNPPERTPAQPLRQSHIYLPHLSEDMYFIDIAGERPD
jgi:hypothetical protein